MSGIGLMNFSNTIILDTSMINDNNNNNNVHDTQSKEIGEIRSVADKNKTEFDDMHQIIFYNQNVV